jgi:hypothetical protein
MFIILPTPGDNCGDGGFMIDHVMFVKLGECVMVSASGIDFETPTGMAKNNQGTETPFPEATPVLRFV